MDYIKKYDEWVASDYFDNETKIELKMIENDNDEKKERFYDDLRFGTGGMRGIIGAGTNRINKYTVRRASYGLGKFILRNNKGQGVVIAHDSRHKSREFCMESANMLNSMGINTYMFDDLRSTPELSFAVRYLGAQAGIVITASHNPSIYNGYKVYASDGSQIDKQMADEIINEINMIDKFDLLKVNNTYDKNVILKDSIDREYIKAIKNKSFEDILCKSDLDNFKIVYTPLHGTGEVPVKQILKEVGFEKVYYVPKQDVKDPNFSTVKFPNPEDKNSYDLAMNVAIENDADIILATDPDCDRVGIAVKHNNKYEFLTGNEIGALLVEFILSNLKLKNALPDNAVIIKSIVTSQLGEVIAKQYGVNCINTLVGFKYIGQKITEIENNENMNFIFGYEESYGYLYGDHARDKDGVMASMLIAQMGAYYKKNGMDLYDVLQSLYKTYGYYKSELKSLTFEGISGKEKIDNIMNYFRDKDNICIDKITKVEDYIDGIDGLPKENVITLHINKSCITLRPSGTEPKIKFYFMVSADSLDEWNENVLKMQNEFMKIINEIIK